MSTQPLEAAIASTRSVLGGVSQDQLDAATPCASWKVRELLNHIVGGQQYFAALVSGEAFSPGEHDWAAGNFASDFDANSAACVAAFSAPGAMEKMLHLPFGDMPGAGFVGLAATDTFVHGWDLANATGQDTNLDPDLAGGLLVGAKAFIQDSIRGNEPMPFGPQQQAPVGASAADELAAFLGRTV
ncbi:MAG TPA: TIGR03086 family metal-binding protein [Acidimicrobiia bacterium]|jgi:uncharacterized protein (TIGR03086 family)